MVLVLVDIMPVSTAHPDYSSNLPSWRKQRHFRDGSEAVKNAGTAYLPMLSGQDDEDYKGFKDRALFYGASGRTQQALAGAIFRKNPVINFPGTDSEEILKHVGKAGESAQELMKRGVEEQLLPARVGALVDAPEEDNAAPFVTLYYAEDIINWSAERRGDSEEPTEVVLREEFEVRDEEDPFKVKRKTQYRVLRLGKPADQGDGESPPDTAIYYQEVWVEIELEGTTGNTGKTTFILDKTIVPKMWGGRTLDRIPFTFFNARSLGVKPEVGPLAELVAVNHSHYLSAADLEHGRHFTALPTPVLTGFNPEYRLKIGSGVAWITDNVNAKAYFLEFTGSGLTHLVEGQKHKEHLMATLGARLLEEPKAGVESADALRLRSTGEQSALSSLVSTADLGWSRTLGFLAEWRGLPAEQASAQLNRDFDTSQLDPTQAAVWMQQVQAGLMSYETFYHNMRKAEAYPEDWTIELERAAIETGPPMAPPATEEGEIGLESSKVALDTSKEALKQMKEAPREEEAA